MFKNIDLQDAKYYKSGQKKNMYHVKDMNPHWYNNFLSDEERDLHDANFAFVSTTLAKLHQTAYEPIWFTTYAMDIPIDVGGGFVDYVEYFTVDWRGLARESENLFGNNGTIIPRVNASLNQATKRVYTYEVAYDLSFVELQKLNKVRFQKSIQEIYQQQIFASYELFAQRIAYLGRNDQGDAGFFNNPNVKVYSVPAGVSTETKFSGLTNEEIVSFFNGVFATYLVESNHNLSLMPDTFLLPIADSRELSDRISDLLTRNLRDFILNNNYGLDEVKGTGLESNFNFSIRGREDLDSIGTFSNGRIVAYRKDKKFVRMDQPYPLQMHYTGPNVERASYTTIFVAQLSPVQLPYNEGNPDSAGEFAPVTYWDFGAT